MIDRFSRSMSLIAIVGASVACGEDLLLQRREPEGASGGPPRTSEGTPGEPLPVEGEPDPVPDARKDEQADFYDPGVVQDVDLEISEDDLQRLDAALPERIVVPGTFRWRDITIERAGIQYKGNSSSSPPGSTSKRGFLVKFGEYIDGQKFLGLSSVGLDNGIQFGSLFSERLITEILRDAGIIASRANHARARINGRYVGVYVNVERVNKGFLERNFSDPEGNLYKCDEGGAGADLSFIGDDPSLYRTTFEAKTHEATADRSDIVELVRTIRDAGDGEIGVVLPRIFDTDAFLRTMSIMLLSGAFDQYTGFNPHNYFLYREPAGGRWTYVPWDLDVGFADHAFGQIPVIDGWNASYPVATTPRPLVERIARDPILRDLSRAYTADYLERYFHPDRLGARLDELYSGIELDIADDPFPPGRVTTGRPETYTEVLASMKAFMRERYDRAREELASPRDTPEPGIDGTPTDLRVVRATSSRVDLAWIDHAIDEGGFILERCAGDGCEDFQDTIGLPGRDITLASDESVVAGMTYRYRVNAVRPTPGGPATLGPSNVVTAVAVD